MPWVRKRVEMGYKSGDREKSEEWKYSINLNLKKRERDQKRKKWLKFAKDLCFYLLSYNKHNSS